MPGPDPHPADWPACAAMGRLFTVGEAEVRVTIWRRAGEPERVAAGLTTKPARPSGPNGSPISQLPPSGPRHSSRAPPSRTSRAPAAARAGAYALAPVLDHRRMSATALRWAHGEPPVNSAASFVDQQAPGSIAYGPGFGPAGHRCGGWLGLLDRPLRLATFRAERLSLFPGDGRWTPRRKNPPCGMRICAGLSPASLCPEPSRPLAVDTQLRETGSLPGSRGGTLAPPGRLRSPALLGRLGPRPCGPECTVSPVALAMDAGGRSSDRGSPDAPAPASRPPSPPPCGHVLRMPSSVTARGDGLSGSPCWPADSLPDQQNLRFRPVSFDWARAARWDDQ